MVAGWEVNVLVQFQLKCLLVYYAFALLYIFGRQAISDFWIKSFTTIKLVLEYALPCHHGELCIT